MDRNREARRGTMTSVNGVLPRRRQRGSGLRDSPEENGALEMQETTRLRDRGSRKERDRDRSSRSKRRRGDRLMHGSHGEEGDESSEESVDEEEDDDEEDASVAVRLPAPTTPTTNASMQSQQLRKGFPAKPARPPGTGSWKVAEEMIGAPIPRKARSSSVKRSQECWVSGGEQVHRQTSTSPTRPSPSSTAPVSPSSSNASVRKKIKPISGAKHRPPKTSKASSSSIQEIEIEVAEVLFGMTRHVPPKQESINHDLKEANGLGSEVKSRISSPTPISSPLATSQPAANLALNSVLLTTAALKKKRPRMRFDEESPTSPPSSFPPPAASVSSETALLQSAGDKVDTSTNSEKKAAFPAVENGGAVGNPALSIESSALVTSAKVLEAAVKPEDKLASDPMAKEETNVPKETPGANLGVNLDEPPTTKSDLVSESQREEKFSIDLMVSSKSSSLAPPPGKPPLETETASGCAAERKPVKMEMVPKPELAGVDGEKVDKSSKTEDGAGGFVDEKLTAEDMELNKQAVKERNPYHLHDLENPDRDVAGPSKHQAQKQPPRAHRADSRIEKAVKFLLYHLFSQWTGAPNLCRLTPPLSSLYAPSITDILCLQSFLSSQIRPKRCSTHCYIAQNIHYHQQIARLNPFWASAAGAGSLYGPKQYNINSVTLSESAILGSPLPGSLPGRSLGSVQEKGGLSSSSYSTLSNKDKGNSAANPLIDSQRKPPLLPPSSQPGSSSNMLAPALIFPLNQQQAAASPAAAASRSGAAKLTSGNVNAAQSSPPTNNGTASSMSFNYPGLPSNEAQYLAFLQNNGYPFPIPAHVGGPPPFRGANPAQAAMPFYNLSFYPQMIHPSQLRQQPPPPPSSQQPGHSPQGHQNQSNSSGSSSSQKQQHSQQSQRILSTARGNPFPHSRQLDSEAGCEDPPSTADSRGLQHQKSIYNQKVVMPVHSQNFALISPAPAAASSNNEKQHQQQLPQQTQNQVMKMDLTPSQAFAMSFASFAGAGEAAAHGVDFSSMAQNALFHGLPEAARHGYHVSAAAAAAVHAAQQQRKRPEEAKSASELANLSTGGEEGKVTSANNKVAVNTQQHSLTFSRAETDPQISSILNNSTVPRPSGLPGTPPAVPNPSSQQQVLQMQRQLQQQQQQRAKPSSSPQSNVSLYPDRLPGGGSNSSKFPPALAGFPPALIPNNSSTQSPQWKSSVRPVISSSVPAGAPSPSAPSAKNQIPLHHQQIRSQHQTQISFGVSPAKVPGGTSAGTGNAASLSSSPTVMVGSPQNSVSKSSGGSPLSSSGAKQGPSPSPVPPVLPYQKQQLGKNSPSSSSNTPLPATSRNMPSILGNPHFSSGQNSSSKAQIPQHQPIKQQFPQAQFFFSNPYVQSQASQPDATLAPSASGFFQQHQRRSSDQQQQQNSTGMLSVSPSSLAAADPLNAAAAASAGGKVPSPATTLLQHTPAGAPHPLMTAAATAFPYIHTMQSVSLKPSAEQKPAAGR
ncbi:Protein time for coffee [Apostasia shenzhenica]|uniref:Protein time for coffee n=1 Tax=Apostasia shenzhenica TaxID=1088818 RepID=A0A2I0B0R9_9ASPA|nr:Protein time for coffee [Apostasia shenzhenica]